MALFAPLAMNAQATLTVYDDEENATTNGYVPIYGYFADAYLKCEFVIPAEQLSVMDNHTITEMTFYLSTPANDAWTGKFQVFLKEVEDASISDFSGTNGATIVYEGALHGTSETLGITFEEDYTYEGGNLLVGVYETEKGNYTSARFSGQTVEGASVQGYSYSSLDGVSATQRNFIPKTTFSYLTGEASACAKPKNVQVDYTGGHTAQITWTGDANIYDILVNEEVMAGNVSSPYTLSDLDLATTYSVQLRAMCSANEYSDWTTAISFTTDLCELDEMCELTFELTDSWGDGWNGNAINVVDVETGTVLAQMANQNLNGTSGSGENEVNILTLAVCDGRVIRFEWVSGSYPGETSYTVYDVNDEVIFSGSGTLSEAVSYTVSCAVNNCKRPTDLIAKEITSNSADLSWTVNNPDMTAFNVRYRVAADNGASFFDDFEGDVSGWTLIDSDGDGYNWGQHINTGSGNLTTHSDVGCMYSASYDNDEEEPLTPDNWLITPQVQLGGTVKFWARGQDASYASEVFAIYVSTTDTDINSFTSVSDDYTATGSYVEYTADLSAYGGQKGYVAIRHYNVTDQFYLNIDDFGIYAANENEWEFIEAVEDNPFTLEDLEPNTTYEVQVQGNCSKTETTEWTEVVYFTTLPSCPAPSDVTFTDITYNSATVSWTEPGTATSWQLEVYSYSDYQTTDWGTVTPITVTENPYTITDLSPNENYIVYVYANCDEGEVSLPSDFAYFQTLDSPCEVPSSLAVSEVTHTSAVVTWESEGIFWEIAYGTAEEVLYNSGGSYYLNENALDPIQVNETSYTLEDLEPVTQYYVFVRSYCEDYQEYPTAWINAYTYFTTEAEPLCEPEEMCKLTFELTDSWGDGWNGNAINVVDVETGTVLAQMANQNLNGTSGSGENEVNILTLAVCDGRVIRFEWVSGSYPGETSYTVYDVNDEVIFSGSGTLSEAVSYTVSCAVNNCKRPTDLIAKEITSNSADLSWTVNNPDMTAFNVRYRVAADNGASFFDDFEGDVSGWTLIDSDGDGYNWGQHINTGSGNLTTHSDVGCMYSASYDNDEEEPLTPDNWLITPQVQLGGTVKFWARGQDASYASEVFAIYVSTTDTDINSFTSVSDDYTATGSYVEYTADLSAYGGQKGYVAIRHYNVTDQFYLNIDDFGIYANDLTEAGEWITIDNVANPYTLDGLLAETSYDVQVQGICDEDEVSDWSDMITFTTEPASDVEQTLTLSAGWGWFSSYIEYPADALSTIEAGIASVSTTGLIKSQTQAVTLNEGVWEGTLETMENEQMYLILSEGGEVSLSGPLADPEEHPIELGNGWSWIGFLSPEAMGLNAALSSIDPAEGDLIKSQTASATYYEGQWTGDQLQSLEPGMGYIYLHNGDGLTLVYPSVGKGVVNTTPVELHWDGNHNFATNLTMMVTLDESEVGMRAKSHEVGAFVNGECRGSARLEPANGGYVAILTVSGEAGEEVSFRLYDVTTGEEYPEAAKERVSYSADAVYGSIPSPMRLHFGTTGVGETSGAVSVYPNPTSDKVRVMGTGISAVRVYNAMGQLLCGEEGLDTGSVEVNLGHYSAGVYTVSVTLTDGQTTNKLVVKE